MRLRRSIGCPWKELLPESEINVAKFLRHLG